MIFDQISADRQLALFTAAALEALERWEIRGATAEILGLRSNAVFAVRVPQANNEWRLVLRVNWPGRKPFRHIHSELLWMDLLHRHDLPVPAMIYMPRTVALSDAPEMVCTLLSYFDSPTVAPTDYTPAHAEAVGRVVARIHGVEHGFAADPKFQRPRLDYSGLFGVESPYFADAAGELLLHPHRGILDAVSAQVGEIFVRLHRMGGQFGLIHGDLKPDNLLFAAPDQPLVLDFDDCGWGFYVYDLAPFLLFLKPNPAYAELKAALWSGYTALKPLPDGHFDSLETLVAGRFVASCRWVAAHRDHPAYRGKVEGILAERAARLAGYLKTGAL